MGAILSSAASFVAIVGSRTWASEPAPVRTVVSSLVGAGWGIGVGCCKGADALVLCSAAGSPAIARRTQVFAQFGPLGVGAVGVSAVGAVEAAAAAGATVHWWAGGAPSVPVRARLAARTRAMLASSQCAGVVAFLSSASTGSVAACRQAAGQGLPVIAFGGHLFYPPAPLFEGGGSWVTAGSGIWAFAWAWVPSQSSAFPAPPPPWLHTGFQRGRTQ